MLGIEIKPGIFYVGMNDHDTELFEGLWPIKAEGVSLNSYLVMDEKKALIDLTREVASGTLIEQLRSLTSLDSLDYVVINHMEPDHSGALQLFRQLAPHATLLGTEKTRAMLDSWYGFTDGVRAVTDGETLSLGQHTLRFIHTPFIHWPETMMTYEESEQVLFSCDAFGGYGALPGSLYDDECRSLAEFEQQALRYYVNIVAVHSRFVQKAITKLGQTPIQMVAPSHGLLWRGQPRRIIDLYQKWAGYVSGEADAGITLLYGSMYGSTLRMMDAVARGIAREGVPLNIFNVASTHASYFLPSLWLNRGVMVGAPTYEGFMFPPMVQALEMARTKRIPGRTAALFGSYGWSGGAKRHFETLAEGLKWKLADDLQFAGVPGAQELENGVEFGARFARTILNPEPAAA